MFSEEELKSLDRQLHCAGTYLRRLSRTTEREKDESSSQAIQHITVLARIEENEELRQKVEGILEGL